VAENRFARARAYAGLSLGQAAKLLGTSRAELEAIERGDIAIEPQCLADLYGCSIAWLIGEKPLHDYDRLNRIPGGDTLYSGDRAKIAELLASLPDGDAR
jgi:DNA-binding XRE family transcriptional regulator